MTTGASRRAVMSATAVNPSVVVGVEASIEPVVDRPDDVYMRLHAPPWDTRPGIERDNDRQ